MASGPAGHLTVVIYEPVAVAASTAITPPVATRRRTTVIRRAGRVLFKPPNQISPTWIPPNNVIRQPARFRGLRIPRGKVVTTPLTQAVAVAVTFTPPIGRPQRRLVRVRKGQTVTTFTVTVTVPGIASKRRLNAFKLIRRGTIVTTPQTQTATVTATYVPPIPRPVRRRHIIRRGATVATPPTQTATVTVSTVPSITTPRRYRGAKFVRRGAIAQVTVDTTGIVVAPYVPSIPRPARRWGIIRRGTVSQTAAATVTVVVPPYVPPITRPFFRRSRTRAGKVVATPPAQTVTVTIPVPAIARPTRRFYGIRRAATTPTPPAPLVISVAVPIPAPARVRTRLNGTMLRRRTALTQTPIPTFTITDAYVLEPGTASNNVSTPHVVAYDPAGDMTVVTYIAPDSWRPATAQVIASDYNTAADGAWQVRLNSAGTLSFAASVGGVAATTASTSIVVPNTRDGFGKWLYFYRQSSNGQCDFKYSNDPPSTAPESVTWTNIQINRAGTLGVLTAPTTSVQVGGFALGVSSPFAGKIFRTTLYHAVTPVTKIWDMNPGDWSGVGNTWVSAATGETWTINGTASVVLPTAATVTFVPFIPRPVRRWGIIRRGAITQTTIAATVVIPVPPYVAPVVRRTLRGFTRRGRVVTTPLTQTVTVTISNVPAIRRSRSRLLGFLRRSRATVTQTTIAAPVVVVIPVPGTTTVTLGLAARTVVTLDRQGTVTDTLSTTGNTKASTGSQGTVTVTLGTQ